MIRLFYLLERVFSEIDESLDFNETLVKGSVLNVASMNNIRLLRISLSKKLLAFKIIYFVRKFVCNR